MESNRTAKAMNLIRKNGVDISDLLTEKELHFDGAAFHPLSRNDVGRQDGTLNTNRGWSVLLIAGVSAIIVFIVAALNEPHSVGALQSRNDGHEFAEVKIENSHEADARS